MAEHAQRLVYSVISLMPSVYQKASLKAVLELFLEGKGDTLPEQTQVASSLSRFYNRYCWSTRHVIRTARAAIFDQLATRSVRKGAPVRLFIALSTLKKTGKFWYLSTPTEDVDAPTPWVRMLNVKLRFRPVVLYILVGQRRIPGSCRVWRGKGELRPNQLAYQLLTAAITAFVQAALVMLQRSQPSFKRYGI